MNRREWVLYGQKELEEAQIENASGDAWIFVFRMFSYIKGRLPVWDDR